jgi:hypothetical protein
MRWPTRIVGDGFRLSGKVTAPINRTAAARECDVHTFPDTAAVAAEIAVGETHAGQVNRADQGKQSKRASRTLRLIMA